MQVDILAFGAHPDDVELGCAGTLIKHIKLGYKVAIIDLTAGELGTRGTDEIRLKEAEASAKLMGAMARENLHMADGFFTSSQENILKVINVIRKYRPKVVFANAVTDRHPDHGRGSSLLTDACFYSGLRRIETGENGATQEAWRPQSVYHYIQFRNINPDFAVDISEEIELKMRCIKTFESQFYDPKSEEPSTIISSPEFLESVYQRAADMGRIIGVKYGEGFTVERYPGVKDVMQLL
jgi:bacillithiol biosynthesis deacetylase BshB1